MLIPKKYALGILVLALAGLIALGFQKGWIGKRTTHSVAVKSNAPVNIEMAEADIAIAQKMTMTQGRQNRHGQSPCRGRTCDA